MEFHPEIYTITEYGLLVNGWVASETETSFLVCDQKGEELPSAVTFYPRSDLDGAFGFRLQITLSNAKRQLRLPLTILATGDEEQSTVFSKSDYRKLSYESAKGFVPTLYRGLRYFRRFGARKTWQHFVEKTSPHRDDESYQKWRRENVPDEAELLRQRKTEFIKKPLISIVVPLYRTEEIFFRQMVDSVRAQTYANWELCLADGSKDAPDKKSPLEGMLREATKSDDRIHYQILDKNEGISENTNRGIEMARGDWIIFLDHDDLLSADALFELAAVINASGNSNETNETHAPSDEVVLVSSDNVDVIYSDQDKVDADGQMFYDPIFKEDFDMDRLCQRNDLAHLFAVKRELLENVAESREEIAGRTTWQNENVQNVTASHSKVYFRDEFDGAQDYDLIFRCVEKAKEVCHIPKVLYHWREHPQSTAKNPASKNYAYDAGRRAILAHYRRLGLPATVAYGEHDGEYITNLV